MPPRFLQCFIAVFSCLTAGGRAFASPAEEIRPFLEQYCLECHGGEKVKGKIDFTEILASTASLEDQFETWETVRDVLEFEEMPPEDELQPSDGEREKFSAWYGKHFVESVEAKPGAFQPRRLSTIEYRHTLRSLIGFDLEVTIAEAEQTVVEKSLVMKLLPTDPPGTSGFTNDTRANPLSTVSWDQYSYLVDSALEELFSRKRRAQLEALTGPLKNPGPTLAQAETLMRRFIEKAWRRSVPEEDVTKFLKPLETLEGKPLIAALKREMKAVLMSPAFLYRGVLVEGKPGAQQAVDDFELAERLSYFLWADMPDEELQEIAAAGNLSDPKRLHAQVERLLDSPRSRSLGEIFAVQWLSLDEIEKVSNNPPVTEALRTQPIDFVDYLFREDRPVIELIDSDTTFFNIHTAKYYGKDRGKLERYVKQKGIEVEMVPNQKITLEHAALERGGLLTMPGILAMNKGPVIRGTWMLERILGDHLSDPPADVGVVEPNRKGEKLSFRERFEQHRSDPSCAVCHNKIDPLGFAMQAYDQQGSYLLKADTAAATKKKKGRNDSEESGELDTSGQLPSGEIFGDFPELREILVTTRRQTIIRNIVERTLSYALCRKLEIYDQPTVESIVTELESGDGHGTYRELVHLVVNSLPFREATFPAEES